MAITLFKPEVWAAVLLSSLKKALVYGAPGVANRSYEGEVRNAGDTVHITSIGRPTINTYVPGTTVIAPQQLTDSQRSLLIDQAKFFAFEVDDVDARQTAGNVIPEAMSEAAFGLSDVADQYIAATYTGVAAANNLGTVIVDTGDKAYNELRRLMIKLDEASVPRQGRWVVVPPWYHGLLMDTQKFIDASASGSTDPLLNGHVGRAAGFDIRVSNNTPNPTTDNRVIIAGYPGAIAYAEQINKTEAYRPDDSFSDAVKGLHLYGAKLVRPDGIAVVTADPTAV